MGQICVDCNNPEIHKQDRCKECYLAHRRRLQNKRNAKRSYRTGVLEYKVTKGLVTKGE